MLKFLDDKKQTEENNKGSENKMTRGELNEELLDFIKEEEDAIEIREAGF